MPNHITNGVTISHKDKDKLAELKKKVIVEHESEDFEGNKTGETYTTFDFNAIIPMPESMSIQSGSETDKGMAAYDEDRFKSFSQYPWFKEHYPGIKTAEDFRKHLEKDEKNAEALRMGKQALENIEKYGYKDWYDWSNANWGTKWNAYSFSLVGEDENSFSVQFDTAWAPPTPIFEKLVDMGFDVGAVSIDEDSGVEPYYFGDFDMGGYWYVNRSLEFEG